MWTYSPQKRQAGSAFALTYRLFLRSCKLMGVFVISPLPSFFVRVATHSRAPLLHSHYSRFVALTGPSATLSPSFLFPVSPVIGRTCSRAFPLGRGGLLQLLNAPLPSCCR